jgi:hypothetical protein
LSIKQKDPDRVQAMLQNVISKLVVNPDYSVLIQIKLVCLELVPRTRTVLSANTFCLEKDYTQNFAFSP